MKTEATVTLNGKRVVLEMSKKEARIISALLGPTAGNTGYAVYSALDIAGIVGVLEQRYSSGGVDLTEVNTDEDVKKA